ncbi:hypothetical protein QUA83_08345 [Microcoleus sp. K1-B1]
MIPMQPETILLERGIVKVVYLTYAQERSPFIELHNEGHCNAVSLQISLF